MHGVLGTIFAGQLFVEANSPSLEEILLMVKLVLPVFVTVTFFAALVVFTVWLAKVSTVGLRLMTAPVPTPESVTDCGLAGALSVTERAPVKVPAVEGLKLTLIVQFCPLVRLAGQLLVCK